MKFADTKVVIRVDNTLTQREKKDKRTNNDLQSTSQKLGVISGVPER
jgi:hypothetical protein